MGVTVGSTTGGIKPPSRQTSPQTVQFAATQSVPLVGGPEKRATWSQALPQQPQQPQAPPPSAAVRVSTVTQAWIPSPTQRTAPNPVTPTTMLPPGSATTPTVAHAPSKGNTAPMTHAVYRGPTGGASPTSPQATASSPVMSLSYGMPQ